MDVSIIEVALYIFLMLIELTWLVWIITRLSYTSTFPITSWKDFIPLHKPDMTVSSQHE